VKFQNLGLCVIDEQHRFGVAQRAKLWNKNKEIHPHILVMTATPIPRTLAMTLYGDLDVSVIDELPAGRKPIKTVHRYDSRRLEVFQFIRDEILKNRQVYIVYPLIEESEQMDFKNLMDGYESISRAFPNSPLSIVHVKMKPKDKDYEMQRFVKGETEIMVATTVIEVGEDYDSDLLFYSRRIGSSLHSYPDLNTREYAEVPQNTSILGAAKFSGKTKNGWSIGLLESITLEGVGTIQGEDSEP
jgi:RecG-like helicase